MTNLINQKTINGQTNTFLNYVSNLEDGVNCGISGINSLLSEHLGAVGTNWNVSTNGAAFAVRFPTAWETLTGSIAAPTSTAISINARFMLAIVNASASFTFLNSANGTSGTRVGATLNRSINTSYSYYFGVCNNNSLVIATFTSLARTTCYWQYVGWLKSPQYDTGTAVFPRNAVWLDSGGTRLRVAVENTTTSQSLLSSNPTLSCSVSTPGANSTDVIIRDSASPNNYIGQLWNMMVLPSSVQVGEICKNTGIDPDTGQVETDEKAFWLCIGSWGTEKIGMRVFTENII